jgi:hypothetical protein
MITSTPGARLRGTGLVAVLAAALTAGMASLPAGSAQAAVGSSPASHHGQPSVNHRQPSASPQPQGRQWLSFAFDPATDEFVLFGGNNGNTVLGDTWTRTGSTWTQQDPATSPSPRTGAAMVYDPATSQLLLFGGSSRPTTEGGYDGDTWIWTGSTWTELNPATSPSPRHNADMIYDAASQEVILFGGYGGSYLGDTWAWNGTDWTLLSPATSPSARDSESLVYDQATQTALMFGGFSSTTGRLSDTWEWNGTTWTELFPATSPGTVTTAWQAAYDAASQQVLLFGGDPGDDAPPSQETWTWTGTTWAQLSPASSPSGRVYGSMSYNTVSQRIVLSGGATNRYETRYPRATPIPADRQ